MEVLTLNAFPGGVNEAVEGRYIEQTELQELVNMILDKPGKTFKPVSRGGFASSKSYSLTEGVESAFELMDQAGSTYFIISTDGFIKVGTPTWTDILIYVWPGALDHAPLEQGKYIITNGLETIYVIYGVAFASKYTLEVPAPNMQWTWAEPLSGGELAQNTIYRWCFAFSTVDGGQSNVSRPVSYMVDPNMGDVKTTDTTNKTIRINAIPISYDPRVSGVKVYRTEANGETFYLRTTLQNGDTEFIDKAADTVLDKSESIKFTNVPSSAKCVAMHDNRVFLGNFQRTYKNAVTKPANLNVILGNIEASPTVALYTGNYYWAFSFIDKDGRESELGGYLYASVNCAAHGVAEGYGWAELAGAPMPRIGSGDYDPDVRTIRMYRAKMGTLGPFYYVKDYPADYWGNAPGGVNDNTPDSALTLQYPSTSKGATSNVDYKSHIAFSELDQPYVFPDLYVLPVYPDDGDEITGLISVADGVIVLKKRSICKVFTSQASPLGWRAMKMVETVGSETRLGHVQTPGGIYFAMNKRAYFYPEGGSEVMDISQKFTKTWDNVTTVRNVAYWAKRGWVIYNVVLMDLTYRFLIYDTKLKTWYNFRMPEATYWAFEGHYGQYKGFLYTAILSGIVNYDDIYTSDYPASGQKQISTSLKTKTFSFQDGVSLATMRNLHAVYIGLSSGQNVTIKLADPYAGAYAQQSQANPSFGLVYRRFNTGFQATACYIEMSGSVGELEALKLYYNTLNRGRNS